MTNGADFVLTKSDKKALSKVIKEAFKSGQKVIRCFDRVITTSAFLKSIQWEYDELKRMDYSVMPYWMVDVDAKEGRLRLEGYLSVQEAITKIIHDKKKEI